ncbi:Serine/threonine protein kinase [Phytophthora megakarya]|uniref:Serine/threonine protein kinase n=1 Tax=Phytophthora megakarya TaxID=4795 RepID=A0A225UHC6_9STRA|nr:Serine/threonine protein kinase [Phytophthora megakarya]
MLINVRIVVGKSPNHETLCESFARERNEQWQQQLNDIIMSGVSGNDHLLLDLKSPEHRSIVLKALKSELRNSQLKYTSDQLEAKDVAYETIASEIDIDNLMPEWFIPRYELIIDECSELGKGGFGSVYQAKWLDSDVVVKEVLLAGDDKDSPDYSCSSFSASQDVQSTQTNDMERVQALMMFRREVDIWFGLNHPHIIHLLGACHVGKPFFICEHATNGTMVKYLQKYCSVRVPTSQLHLQ